MYKVIINGVEQDGEYTAEECGEKTATLLTLMGSMTIEYKRIKEVKE